jgi:regulator of replication initiation timing
MSIDAIIDKEAMSDQPVFMQREIHRVHQFYKRVTDLAEANHKTASTLVEENGRLENENEGLREFCQELLGSMADLEEECSEFRHKVRSAVLELLPHQKEENK